MRESGGEVEGGQGWVAAHDQDLSNRLSPAPVRQLIIIYPSSKCWHCSLTMS